MEQLLGRGERKSKNFLTQTELEYGKKLGDSKPNVYFFIGCLGGKNKHHLSYKYTGTGVV